YAVHQPQSGAVPIIIQPGAPLLSIHWIAVPPSIPGCPPGLEFLHSLDKVIIKQKQELLELISSIEVPNKYSIETVTGEKIYSAAEDCNLVQAQIMRNQRGYRINVVDGFNRIAFTIIHPLQFCRCSCLAGFDSCKRTSSVEGSGKIFGEMYTRDSCCSTSLTVTVQNKRSLFTIDGPCQCTRCCEDSDFPVRDS
ncbi:hypothetical protein PFISCL1PPCAC_18756, partial [Pristionchus fissidentatus]